MIKIMIVFKHVSNALIYSANGAEDTQFVFKVYCILYLISMIFKSVVRCSTIISTSITSFTVLHEQISDILWRK